MQRTYTSGKTVPIATFALALLCTGTGVAQEQPEFASNEVEACSETLRTLPGEYILDPDIKNWMKFQKLAHEWRDQRGAMSSITEMSMLPAYQSIIGMGNDAVMPIIAQLKSEGDEPDQWFWALRAITGANPVRPEEQGDFVKMADSWIKWVGESYAG